MDAKSKLPVLSPETTIEVGLLRLTHYIWAMAITIAADIALLVVVLSFAPDLTASSKIALAVIVVAVTAFGALGGRSALGAVKAAVDDFVEQSGPTHYSRELARQPMALFIALTFGLVSLMGLALLVLIWGI